MLSHLSVTHLGVVERLALDFSPGMTSITGETGAGKSLVIGALALLAGRRAESAMIRNGEESCDVVAEFSIPSSHREAIAEQLEAYGLPAMDGDQLIVQRRLHRSGRHRQRVNCAPATLTAVRDLVAPLLLFTGQNASQQLTSTSGQRELLDALVEETALFREVGESYRAARDIVDEMARVRALLDGDTSRGDWLRYQIDEIDALEVREGEDDELAEKRTALQNATSIAEAAQTVAGLLVDDDGAALERVQSAARVISKLEQPGLSGCAELLESAATQVDEAHRSLRSFVDDVDASPDALQEVDDRLFAIRALYRKHGGSYDGLMTARQAMLDEIELADSADRKLAELERQLDDKKATLGDAVARLSRARLSAAERLSSAVEGELSDLGMAGARFVVDVSPQGTAGYELTIERDGVELGVSEHGADAVTFNFGANAGEALGPLAKVASGGERSRLLLALQSVALKRRPIPVAVFDEIDSGLGGETANAVAERLRRLSEASQVLCITHLGVVASVAENHLAVEKTEQDGRTFVDVKPLSKRERIDEVARMLSGGKSEPKAVAHAKALLKGSDPVVKSKAKSNGKSKASPRRTKRLQSASGAHA